MPTQKHLDTSVTKPERTIKVKTLLLALLFVAIVFAAIGFGWVMRSDADSAYHANVMSEAEALLSKLK